ncbi:uncharacterized protein RG961_006266 isoform 1-T1 [Leptosomus discolor]
MCLPLSVLFPVPLFLCSSVPLPHLIFSLSVPLPSSPWLCFRSRYPLPQHGLLSGPREGGSAEDLVASSSPGDVADCIWLRWYPSLNAAVGRGHARSLGGAKPLTDQRPEEARRLSARLESESGASCGSLVKCFCAVVQVLRSCLWSWVPQAMTAAASNTGIGAEQLSRRPRSF